MAVSAILVLCTVPSRAAAQALSKKILSERLAACVNLSAPVTSLYWWKGRQEKASEVMLFIKTRKAHFSKLEKFIRKNHPYDVPEVIALPIVAGSRPYLEWLANP